MFAIATFGSSVRQETDSYSDQDLLIVCADHNKNELYEKYLGKGYSVTALSERQLEFMQKSGALFIQHLKLESNTIVDEGGLFRRFLDSCDLISPSQDELYLCERTISKISMMPDSKVTDFFRADFLYCVSRDYLIKRLACKGCLAFGFNDVRDASVKSLGFNINDFDFLFDLRKVKSGYRDGSDRYRDVSSLVSSWLLVLNNVLNISLERGCKVDSVLTVELEGSYEKLRFLEYYYLIARSRGYVHPRHNMLMGYISKPNLYGAARRCNKDTVDSFIFDVRSFLGKLPTEGFSSVS